MGWWSNYKDKRAAADLGWSLFNRWVYTRDGEKDTWRILLGEGKLRGDCDDYALTYQYKLKKKRPKLNTRLRYIGTKGTGINHIAVEVPIGKRTYIADNDGRLHRLEDYRFKVYRAPGKTALKKKFRHNAEGALPVGYEQHFKDKEKGQ